MIHHEESHIEACRRSIERQYVGVELSSGSTNGCFGAILCSELHHGGLHFVQLAEKWGVTLDTLGELVWDHCKRLSPLPKVTHAGF